jgi:predicted AAA+ superfamily ATPase
LQNGIANAKMRRKLALVMPICVKESVMTTAITRIFEPPEQSYFLFGPRGTGKSTLLQTIYTNAIWIDLLAPDVLRQYTGYPERLYDLIKGNPHQKTIVIDEIQKAPILLSVVHKLMEEKKHKHQFVLTGSSSRKLKRTGADLLGGRALNCTLHPFMAAELKNYFDLSHILKYGAIPLTFQASNPEAILQAYINLYLHEEIQMEGWVRNLDNFSRFLEAISFSHGSLLNMTNISRECEVKRKTVENYIEILEDLLLAFQLNVFTKRAQRELIGHPKFYLFDAGVFTALRPKGLLDQPEEREGIALEGLVAQHLRAWSEYSIQKYDLYFWRTRSGLEVDFIVYGENTFWAIEVKNAKKIYSKDLKSLKTFLQDYPMSKALLLYRGLERIQLDGILCVPCEEFLLQLKPDCDLWGG